MIVRANYFLTLASFSLIWIASHSLLFDNSANLPKHINIPDRQLQQSLPDFSKISNTQEKKDAFFNYLLPMIKSENDHILELRETLKHIQGLTNDSVNADQQQWVNELAALYNIKPESQLSTTINSLLVNVDTVPPSLVLAQAAIESGWGTSRFAKEGNNLFGQWCFEKGCGMIPRKRSNNETHEVAKFDDVSSSVRAYLKNVNSFSAYRGFRMLRQKLSGGKKFVDSLALLSGLSQYSEQGGLYLKKIRSVIKGNKLQKFDQ